MKKLVFILIVLVGGFNTQAQFLEFGGGIGGFNYSGDLNRGYPLGNLGPAISGHHRMNFSEYISVKWGLKYGTIKGTDSKPIDAFSVERNASFKQSIVELSSVFEYHFLDYKRRKSPVKWSPYVFSGVSFLRLNNIDVFTLNHSRIQAGIPFGIGFVKIIAKKYSVGFEFGVRKTFYDELDNVSESLDLSLKDYNYGNPVNKDFYSYIGLNFTYILYKIPCPFPYIPNEMMLKR
ncbi:MAG: hypothetical protein JXQ90_12940 [Cyclobacteriaceae bacterium]